MLGRFDDGGEVRLILILLDGPLIWLALLLPDKQAEFARVTALLVVVDQVWRCNGLSGVTEFLWLAAADDADMIVGDSERARPA